MIAEANRHAGRADVVRELIDGAAGLRYGNDNMAPATRRGRRATGAGWRAWRKAGQDGAKGSSKSQSGRVDSRFRPTVV